jgi:hypothetical protein
MVAVRVNAAAAGGAIVATVLAVLGNAAHPAQVVVTCAAAAAFAAVLSRGRRALPGDWFTVQLLLAGNLVVFGISDRHQLGVAVATVVVASGIVLVVVAIWMRQRLGAQRGGGR